LFGISRNTASTDLNGLVEKGIVKRTGKGKRSARYLLKWYAKIVQKNKNKLEV
jgi:predicted HTH transcriptional regulator